MENNQFLDYMIAIQSSLLKFIDDQKDYEEDYQNLINQFIDIKISEDRNGLKSVLHLITKIADNHHRTPNFFSKIERILKNFSEAIKNFYSNSEIFTIFKSNKRLLLFLIEEKILVIDESISKIMRNSPYILYKYPQYFAPEIRPFIEKDNQNPEVKSMFTLTFGFSWKNEVLNMEINESFYEKRKIGENDDEICEIIRNDSIDKFITYVNKKNYPLNSIIPPSIFETNIYLYRNSPNSPAGLSKKLSLQMKQGITLIEYATFFGAIQIFKYLYKNNVQLYPLLWIYAAHGLDAEIASILIENEIRPNNSYVEVFKESIKCHHNEMSNFFLNNYLEGQEEKSHDIFIHCLRNYNFNFIYRDLIDSSSFYDFCKYDYYYFVYNFLKDTNIDVNQMIIFSFIVERNFNGKILM